MPSVLERPKMTRTMYQALKRHIIHEREKKKQEQEHDEALERMRKERELQKKKEQEDSLTLEQTKEQIAQLETKLETLKQEKHELFSQLKKVLHHEDETRKRAQLKEQSELISLGQHYPHSMTVPGHSMFIHGGHMGGRPTMYKSMQQQQHAQAVMAGIKRPRSPSPPPTSMYQSYSKYPASAAAAFQAKKEVQEGPYVTQIKTEPYTQPKGAAYPVSQTTHVAYVTQPGHAYQTQAAQAQQQTASFPTSQSGTKYTVAQAGAKFAAPGSSAFTSYPTHYAHQQQQKTGDPYQGPYPVQRVQQPGYMGSPHAGSLQQQLEHANQKSGFVEDKFKLQQQSIRGMSQLTAQQQSLVQHQIQLQQQQQQQQQQQSQPAAAPQPSQQKGSIVTGYPVRTQGAPQQPTTAYQPQSTQSGYAVQQAPSQRTPGYGGQTPGPGRSYY